MTTATGDAVRDIARLETGIRNFDAILRGGLPRGSVTVLAGAPGTGKTIFAQQVCFHNAAAGHRALYFSTLSEPTAKTLLYLRQFTFFDPAMLDAMVRFVDLGVLLREKGLAPAVSLMMEQIKKSRPSLVVVDSFRVFDDLAQSPEELRKFGYEIVVNLMAWEATALLLGEYGPADYEHSPIFSAVDGLCTLARREEAHEQQRFIQVLKMRGVDHNPDEHAFAISRDGIEVFAPRVTIRRAAHVDGPAAGGGETPRLATGIANLDALLGDGIPLGSSALVGGAPGTGKTLLLLEFVYRGALAGEKGIFFSFEETQERLLATGRGLGWDLEREIARGMLEIVFIPQPDIRVEQHLLMMHERVTALGARRVAIDSVSVFLHRITQPHVHREKVFQLATIVQNAQAVGLFAADVPFGSDKISRFGVEETVVDGVILLTAAEEGLRRQRYLEVYKLRNTAHLKGRHAMHIGHGGVRIFPRYDAQAESEGPPAAVEPGARLPSGVPGLDELLGGGLLPRSVTLVSGSAGVGKSTMAIQFLVAGAARGDPGVYITLEEGPDQLLLSADALGVPLRKAVDDGLIEILYVSQDRARAAQFPSVVTSALGARRARRLVLDSASQLLGDRSDPGDLPQLLHALVVQCKRLGVTSMLTLESKSLFATDVVIDGGLSPVADNLLMLRYVNAPGALRPSVVAIKTRGSAHDWSTYTLEIGPGGMRVGARLSALGGGATGDPAP